MNVAQASDSIIFGELQRILRTSEGRAVSTGDAAAAAYASGADGSGALSRASSEATAKAAAAMRAIFVDEYALPSNDNDD